MTLALAALLAVADAAAPPAAAAPAGASAAAARQERFIELLRTYPSRPVAESLRLVGQLVDAGPFAERDRAIYWLGSVALAARDLPAARASWARLRREHPASIWIERADLGEADACSFERRYGCALGWLQQAAGARDPAVRELSRLTGMQIREARARQRAALAAGAFALLVLLAFVASAWRRGGLHLPLPTEARIALPILTVLALASLPQDPAPRAAVLQICLAGALLVTASGLSLRAAPLGRLTRALHALAALAAMLAAAYVAIYRADLVNMVLETVRAGPD